MMAFHALGNALLTPPGSVIFLILIGLLLQRRYPRSGTATIMVATIALTILSTPAVAVRLLRGLEIYPALPETVSGMTGGPQAIVVLGGGRYLQAPEYGGHDTVSSSTLVRLRYAAHLYRHVHLPVLVSGGSVYSKGRPEALLMRSVLRREFSIPVRWTEARSQDTRQNAMFSAHILRAAHVTRIYLVTQAWHMRRAVTVFRSAGLTVVPAPTAFATIGDLEPSWIGYLPSAYALKQSARAFHEYIGMWWYDLGGG